MRIKPIIRRFMFSWYVYLLLFSIPILPVLWFIPDIGKETFIISLFAIPVMGLFLSVAAYPCYVLIIDGNKLNGATLSGMLWRRTEMNINDIDKERVLKQNLGRKIGVVVFRSRSDIKILSLSLDDMQIMNILESSQKTLA